MVKFIVQLVLTIYYFIDYVKSYVIISQYYICKAINFEYARGQLYDEAVFIEDPNTVIIHEIKSGYTNRCSIMDVFYR